MHPAQLKQHCDREHPAEDSKDKQKAHSRPRQEGEQDQEQENPKMFSRRGEQPPGHQATLQNPRGSTQNEILTAAKKRRIEAHPDDAKRRYGVKVTEEKVKTMEEEANLVGWAADILSDEDLRAKYNERLRAWYGAGKKSLSGIEEDKHGTICLSTT